MFKKMKFFLVLLSLFSLAGLGLAAPQKKNFQVKQYAGSTYLSFMRNVVKPSIDQLATKGYTMCDGKRVASVLQKTDTKVQRQVKQAGKSVQNVMAIADRLAGTRVNLNTLAGLIAKVDPKVDRYKLSTFYGLACGGAITVYYTPQNYGINVHYDVREQKSGRTYGVGPGRLANDASDSKYLTDLERYLEEDPRNNLEFYKNLFKVLLNNDPSEYQKVAREGQSVLTDFLAVFTAEQARNLMDGRVTPHWDAALLEVTLIANFHAGQDRLRIIYMDPNTNKRIFSNQTLAQVPCTPPTKAVPARLNAYWQFSRQFSNPAYCRRSGINVTKAEFRMTGTLVTAYVQKNAPKIYNNLVNSMGMQKTSNVYAAVSKFLINDKLPQSLGNERVNQITYYWMQFLYYTHRHAEEISDVIAKTKLN